MIQFIEDHRSDHGVEPICRVLPIAPTTFYDHLAKRADPSRLSDRAKCDEELKPEVERVFEENLSVYGVRKVWHQMRREGFDIARCTVARLMKDIGIEGVVRGKKPKTTIPDKALPCPLDKVNRQFHAPAPNVLWVSDFTYVATWQGFVYMAFVIDVFARRIVGWRVSRTASAGFVLDALEQAIHQRRPAQDQLVHHSDRGSQDGFKRSSQRFQFGGCDDRSQTCLGAEHPKQVIFTRAAAGGIALAAGEILATDQTRHFQRRGRRASWCVCPSWQSLVSRGRGYATVKVCQFI
jgi:hypothetical protein